jgi:hypothetical protein
LGMEKVRAKHCVGYIWAVQQEEEAPSRELAQKPKEDEGGNVGKFWVMVEGSTHRYTKARMLSIVATSGWPRPEVRSRSSSACLQSGTATS